MSQIHPETPAVKVRPIYLAAEYAEICNINLEFLELLVHPATLDQNQLLGLDGGIIQALRRLAPAELDQIASSPQLLAEFIPLPGSAQVNGVADGSSLLGLDDQWLQQLHGFANRLYACLWQTARHDRFMAALGTGLGANACRSLAEQSFTAISRAAGNASSSLRARFGSHPRVWPDLIRSVRCGNIQQQTASRLALIQLSVSVKNARSGGQKRDNETASYS